MHNVDFKSDLWTLYYIWNVTMLSKGLQINTIIMHNVDFNHEP